MARKRYTPEQIIGMLREAEVRLSQGEKIGAIVRSLGISEQSYYRWRREYGGLKVSQAKRLKDLEKENQRLRNDGWLVNAKRVERIWRREGLKVPQKQPKRGRLWFNAGSCVRLRPQYRGHVWSYDLVADRTHDGKAFRMLTVIDEHSRECLAIHVQRKLRSDDVLAVLTELFQRHGPPAHIRSDNVLWRGICRPCRPRLVGQDRREDALHRARIAMGERLQRVLQRQGQGRAVEWENLLYPEGSYHPHRTLATTLQHAASAQLARLPAASPRNDLASSCRPTRRSSSLLGLSKPAGSANRDISNSRKSSASITSKADHGRACTDTR